MSMRITQSMIMNGTQRSINNSYNRMANLQNQLSTGRVINKPSDNPFGAVKAMQYREQLAEVERLKANTDVADLWLSTADDTMSTINDRMLRVKELVTWASNDPLNEENRKAIAVELKQIKETIGDLANTKVDGKYLFGGASTDQAPYDRSSGTIVNSDIGQINMEIAPGSKMAINVPAVDLFSQGDGLFGTLDNLIKDLEDGTKTGADISAYQSSIDFQHQNLLEQHTLIGIRSQKVEQAIERLEDRELSVTQSLSENEDTDYAKVLTELSAQDTVHKAALSVGARLMQTTLLDFLR